MAFRLPEGPLAARLSAVLWASGAAVEPASLAWLEPWLSS